MSFGTTGVMTLVVLLFLGLLGVNFVSSKIVSDLRDKVDVAAYFKPEASEDEILRVKSDLEALPIVSEVVYISRDQALENFKASYAGQTDIQESLDLLNFNPLEASLDVKPTNPGDFAAVVAALEASRFRTLIDKIDFYENEKVIQRVQSISTGIQGWGLIATLILAAIAVLVTFNTIRLTIYNQRQEIEIMRLVGGSNWFIRTPYLVEGALYGFFAAILALVIFYPTVLFVSSKVGNLMEGLNLFGYFMSNIIVIILVAVVGGVLLGSISSFIAIRRFLRI